MFKKQLFVIVSILITCGVICAQDNDEQGYSFPKENCLSDREEDKIITLLKERHQESKALQRYSQKRDNVKFIFPLKYSSNAVNPGAFAIGSFVDHDEKKSSDHNSFVLDYNCGKRSYDSNSSNHGGTDFFAWPFFWSRMKNDQVEVVAAAQGMIIDKADGHYDLHCSFCYPCSWNAVYIQHSDGSVAWYGHLKRNSLTHKRSGDFVQQGEYLGIVGSSGISQIPHLHFHLWESNEYQNVIDPFVGECNPTISESYWKDQESYFVPMVAYAAVDQTRPNPGVCRDSYEPKLIDSLHAGAVATFTGYFRDPIPGEKADFKIMKGQNGRVLESWSHVFTTQFAAGWRMNTIYLSDTLKAGEYTFEVNYAGTRRSNTFFLINPLENNPVGRQAIISYDGQLKQMNIFNTIEAVGPSSVDIYDMQGKVISSLEFEFIVQEEMSKYPSGIYVVVVSDFLGHITTKKVLVY